MLTVCAQSGWGMMMLYCVHYDSDMLRMFFALSLYMITEQSVFVEMLVIYDVQQMRFDTHALVI